MFTPFEELEYLAEYLPEEGESVVVTRRHGELVCEAGQRDCQRQALLDSALYGRLVQANERLTATGVFPTCSSVLLAFWGCAAVHKLGGVGWQGWYLDLGILLAIFFGCLAWVRARQSRLFHQEIRPMLTWQLRKSRTDAFALLGEVRRHPELRTLMNELWRWVDD